MDEILKLENKRDLYISELCDFLEIDQIDSIMYPKIEFVKNFDNLGEFLIGKNLIWLRKDYNEDTLFHETAHFVQSYFCATKENLTLSEFSKKEISFLAKQINNNPENGQIVAMYNRLFKETFAYFCEYIYFGTPREALKKLPPIFDLTIDFRDKEQRDVLYTTMYTFSKEYAISLKDSYWIRKRTNIENIKKVLCESNLTPNYKKQISKLEKLIGKRRFRKSVKKYISLYY